MPDNITFRTQLLGGVSDFCVQCNLPLINQAVHLVELIVLLARYQEEGVKLTPKVYLTNDMDSVISMLPESERMNIDTTSPDAAGIKLALKKCAPLANSGWLIFIHDKGDQIEFGLFKGSSNPISVLVDTVLMDQNEDLIVVKAFQVADECVEIRANNGNFHYVFLNHRKEDSPPPLQFLDELVSAITQKVKDKNRESVESFLNRLLFDALRKSHGCIIAVTSMSKAPKLLSNDGVILDEPINFSKLVDDLKNDIISPFSLTSRGSLIEGMLNTDGIILFDNKSQLIGYNCFVKVNKNKSIIGGARKRAFTSLTAKLGKGLCAVFMQSQDGWSDFKGINNG